MLCNELYTDYTLCRQYLSCLQIDTSKLLPQYDTIPDVLVEKCAAISVRPDTMKELTGAMDGRFMYGAIGYRYSE